MIFVDRFWLDCLLKSKILGGSPSGAPKERKNDMKTRIKIKVVRIAEIDAILKGDANDIQN